MSTIQITMSERPPVTVDDDTWPVVATEEWRGPNDDEEEAFGVARITVRQHADGRRIVYGERLYNGCYADTAGYIVMPANDQRDPDGVATVRAIRRVAGAVDSMGLAQEVIATLPPEELR